VLFGRRHRALMLFVLRERARQILGRSGEVWLPESGLDRLEVIRNNGAPEH
jgi:streptogramin lyase